MLADEHLAYIQRVLESGAPDEDRQRAAAMIRDARRPSHRHIKSGGLYVEIGRGLLQTDEPLSDMEPVVAYRGADGRLWVRSVAEFGDVTRFAAMAQEKS